MTDRKTDGYLENCGKPIESISSGLQDSGFVGQSVSLTSPYLRNTRRHNNVLLALLTLLTLVIVVTTFVNVSRHTAPTSLIPPAPVAPYPPTHLSPCPTEDSINCYWDAAVHGNGQGASFVNINDTIYYLER